MKTLSFFTALLFGFTTVPALAWEALEPRLSDRKYSIVAYDGTFHELTMRYESGLQWRKWQTGRSSKPRSFRFKDDRQCHYEITTSNGKRAISSVDLATGAQDNMRDPIASRVEGPASGSNADLNAWGNRFLFGPLLNTAEEAERLANIVDAIDWSIEQPLDVLKGPLGTLASVAETGFSGFRVLGNALGRAIGLRTGINCGEAAGLIDLQVRSTRDLHYAGAAALELVDYYISIPEIQREWAYYSFELGGFVGAAMVLPTDFSEDYTKVFEYEAQRLATDVAGEALVLPQTHRQALVDLQIDADLHNKVLEKTLPLPIAKLQSDYGAKKPALEARVADLVSLFPDDINTRVNAFQLTLEKPPASPEAGRLLAAIGVAAETQTINVPNCIVPYFGQATWHGQIAADDALAEKIISGWTSLTEDMDVIADEAYRISFYTRILPEERRKVFAAPVQEILDEINRLGAEISVVERFLNAKSRCGSTYISSDPMAGMLEALTDGDWETVRDTIRRNDGVSDPPPSLMREALSLQFERQGNFALPENLGSLQDLNEVLGTQLNQP